MTTARVSMIAVVCGVLLASRAAPVHANESNKFYRGDLDDQVVEAPNGAMVNKAYRDWILGSRADGPELLKVRDGVHVLTGYSLSNYGFVEGKTGLIAFETGNNMGMGRGALEYIRKVSDLPIKHIIYSHHHYSGGAKAYVDDSRRKGIQDVEIYGHPDVDANRRSGTLTLGPMQFRRANIQLGFYLPHEGPDAYFGPAEPSFDDPADQASGAMNVTRPVGDGEEITIDGLKAIFYHIESDTLDSIAVHFPELDLVLHNAAATPSSFPLYTLRGTSYRNPEGLIAGLDLLRRIKPRYLVGAHGPPYTTKESGYDFLTAHRDLYSFIYNQAIRGINAGMTPDEIVANTPIPPHLDNDPRVFPAYIDHEYALRGQYRGIVGWYAEDTAELHPPAPAELASEIIDGFGGAEKVIQRAQKAFDAKKYNLAARLLSYVLDVDANNEAARVLKARALRAMAYATRSGIQSRDFLLTHALHLEGQLDWKGMPKHSFLGLPTPESFARLPVGTLIKLMETRIDPAKSAELHAKIGFRYEGEGQSWTIAVRRGVAEISDGIADEVAATLNVDRKDWILVSLKQTTLPDLLKSERATIAGDQETLLAVLGAFD